MALQRGASAKGRLGPHRRRSTQLHLARMQETTNPRPEPEVLLPERIESEGCLRRGVKSGVVKSVRVHPELGEHPVKVLMSISTEYELRIPNDSTVILSTEGILGETLAGIDTRNAHGPAGGSDGVLKSSDITAADGCPGYKTARRCPCPGDRRQLTTTTQEFRQSYPLQRQVARRSEVRCDNASRLRRFQQLLQLLPPNGCPGMSAVTTGLFGDWNQHEMTVLYSFDFSFRNSEFRRIDEIVG
jgi:hypothetical protein